MKPTKEQLADPKWWQDNSNGLDFIYECESTGEIAFANTEGKDNNGLRLRLELGIWKLLAKRPEPEWVPDVGDNFEFSLRGKAWEQRTMLYIDNYSMLMASKKLPARRWQYRINDPDLRFKPIKTQREEFVEKVSGVIKAHQWTKKEIAEALYHEGCRFYLTEKDGE